MEEYVDSTKKGKVYFYGWLLLVVLAVAGLHSCEQGIKNSAQFDSLTKEQLVQKIEKDAKTGLIAVIAIQPIFWFGAFMLYRYGERVRVSSRYPPPGAQVPFRMRVQKGQKAKLQAWACYASALMMILGGLTSVYLGWYGLQIAERLLASV